MPTTPTIFNGKIKPFSDEFAMSLRTLAADVQECMSYLPFAKKKALEPDSPQTFSSSSSGQADVKLIEITGHSGSSYPWTYTVTPSGESAGQSATNEYEKSPFGHGQSLTFSGLGNMVPGPLTGGKVLGIRVSEGVWAFDSPCPMVPSCGA